MRHEGDGDEQERDGQHEVDEPCEQGVDHAAEEAGRQPDDDADDHGQERCGNSDEQRDPRAVGDADEDVAPEVVGAQPEGRVRGKGEPVGRESGLAVLLVRRVPGDGRGHRREDREQDDQSDDDEGDHRDPVAAQALPREHPRASPLDVTGRDGTLVGCFGVEERRCLRFRFQVGQPGGRRVHGVVRGDDAHRDSPPDSGGALPAPCDKVASPTISEASMSGRASERSSPTVSGWWQAVEWSSSSPSTGTSGGSDETQS